ncbi:MAG: hypothetical protein E7665_04400 [Ruminococcaceae bacterium]|nr:hypothetical protein [Oscillospiraceae bacterium]
MDKKNFTEKDLESLFEKAEEALLTQYKLIDKNAFITQKRVMDAFRNNKVSAEVFNPTSGYGYNDVGREVTDKLFADSFEAPAAFARHNIVSGTHALTIGLFGLLRTGDTLLSITGKPYDTLDEVIGIRGTRGNGSLMDFGVNYKCVDLLPDGSIDIEGLKASLDKNVKVVYLQLSRGYSTRNSLSASAVSEVAEIVKAYNKNIFIAVDNCYKEFCEEHEPTYYGADLVIGSLIKNAGGGMAESGGYFAGSNEAVELCSYRFTSPGTGLECGATLGQTKGIIKGLFYAPHTVAQALKCAVLASYIFSELGYNVSPAPFDKRYDIIEAIDFGKKEPLCDFCVGIQKGSPVDSFVTPIPWAMPGYDSEVIMAAGAFTQGASIELSADAPIREPFRVFMQGGLTYESAKIGIWYAAEEILRNRN